ncbi:unnamed protein product [Rhizophagus irregularis]|nr:unnamed protein product [Rhizophagus irregularis]
MQFSESLQIDISLLDINNNQFCFSVLELGRWTGGSFFWLDWRFSLVTFQRISNRFLNGILKSCKQKVLSLF